MNVKDAVEWWIDCHAEDEDAAHYLSGAMPSHPKVITNRWTKDRTSVVVNAKTIMRRWHWSEQVVVGCTHRVSLREIRHAGGLKQLGAFIVSSMARQLAGYMLGEDA